MKKFIVHFTKKQQMVFSILTLIFIIGLFTFGYFYLHQIDESDPNPKVMGYELDFNFEDEIISAGYPRHAPIIVELNDHSFKTAIEYRDFMILYEGSFLTLLMSSWTMIYLLFLLWMIRKQKTHYQQGLLKGLFIGFSILFGYIIIQSLSNVIQYSGQMHHVLHHL